MKSLRHFAPPGNRYTCLPRVRSGPIMDAVEKSWHAARAASLCVIPGLGHLYIGEKRGYWMLACATLLFSLMWVLGWPAVLLYVPAVAVSAWDAYLVVTRDRGFLP